MIEIGTREAEPPFRFHSKETTFAELFTTLRADRVPNDPEHHDLTR